MHSEAGGERTAFDHPVRLERDDRQDAARPLKSPPPVVCPPSPGASANFIESHKLAHL
jgi:hypothetical protein